LIVPVARIDINRIDIAVVVSLLVHAGLAMIPPINKDGEKRSEAMPTPFVATIVNTPFVKSEPTPEPLPVPQPVPPVVRPRPIVVPKTVATSPPPTPRPVERPVERTETPRQPQVDMLAMINARRERREQIEEAMVAQERARTAANPSSSDPLAAINRNLQTLTSTEDGTGGVFTILSKGTRTGEFAFNGWRPDTNKRWREVIEVDAGQGGDLERAMVRRMIELIRGHYTGDFIWRSHRLGKNIVMSARPEDGPELEDFLIREFFDEPTLAHKGH
jgi:hypothetical protein